jgi:spermidine synthase
VSARFEEIDRRATPIGEISVRRRLEPTLQVDVYEVKLGDEFLMSSLFTVAEVALADLGLAALDTTEPGSLDVVVGGLGLGYTARAALADPRVRSCYVVEALGAVIGWHTGHLLPRSAEMTDDPRCHFVEGDFFAIVAGDGPFAPDAPERLHAVLLDVDHSPRHLLSETHAPFYEPAGLARLSQRLHPGGVFGLWADGAPDDAFVATLAQVFATSAAHVVTFPNFYTGGESSSTVYVATTTP